MIPPPLGFAGSSPDQSIETFQSFEIDGEGDHTRDSRTTGGVDSSVSVTPLHSLIPGVTPSNVASTLLYGANHVGRYGGVGLRGPSARVFSSMLFSAAPE